MTGRALLLNACSPVKGMAWRDGGGMGTGGGIFMGGKVGSVMGIEGRGRIGGGGRLLKGKGTTPGAM